LYAPTRLQLLAGEQQQFPARVAAFGGPLVKVEDRARVEAVVELSRSSCIHDAPLPAATGL
jgi:hypothetical protein